MREPPTPSIGGANSAASASSVPAADRRTSVATECVRRASERMAASAVDPTVRARGSVCACGSTGEPHPGGRGEGGWRIRSGGGAPPNARRDHGRTLAPGSWLLAPGSWLLAPGSWLLAPGSWLLAPGSWLLAPGSWLLAPGSWLLNERWRPSANVKLFFSFSDSGMVARIFTGFACG